MIETPQANLSRGMRQLNGLYTQRFNHAHDRVGHVFQGRFKSISYQATAGEFPAPVFLDVDWLLAQFGKTQSRPRRRMSALSGKALAASHGIC